MKSEYRRFIDARGELDESGLRTAFTGDLSGAQFAENVFDDARNAFDDQELLQVCEEVVLTVNAQCGADDFHNWNYDHLEFIIECSNRHGFTIPRNLLNGLPEQLIILVDKNKLADPECE
jgi:hypothetical protein